MSLLARFLTAPVTARRWWWTEALPATLVEPLLRAGPLLRGEPWSVRQVQGLSLWLTCSVVLALCLGLLLGLGRLYRLHALSAGVARRAALLVCLPLWLGQLVQRLFGWRAATAMPLGQIVGGRSLGAALAASGIVLLYAGLGRLAAPPPRLLRDRFILSFGPLFALGTVICQSLLPRAWVHILQFF